MAATKRYDVFLSFSSKDEAFVRKILKKFEDDGLRCFVAFRDIHIGENYASTVPAAIKHSKTLMLLCSNAALESPNVMSECRIAFDKRIPILPFKVENVILDDSWMYYLGSAQWLDATKRPISHIESLLSAVRAFVPKPITPEPKPTQNATQTDTTTTTKKIPRWLWSVAAAAVAIVLGGAIILSTYYREQYNYLPPDDEIWYTNGSTTEPTIPHKTDAFGANIVSNTYDPEKECWVIKCNDVIDSISNGAFGFHEKATNSLKTIVLPKSVSIIENNAFDDCPYLREFKSKFASKDGRCLVMGGKLIAFAPAGLTEYTIPDDVTYLEDGAFRDCTDLKSITIPNSITHIGSGVFNICI